MTKSKTEQCSFIECIKPAKANGLCNSHNEQRRAGKVLVPLRGYRKQDPILTEAGLRRCSACEEIKPLTEFYENLWWCKSCTNARTVQYKKDNVEYNREQAKQYRDRYPERKSTQTKHWYHGQPEVRRAYRLKKLYDLTNEQFEAMLAEQDGQCAICRTDKPGGRHGLWQVDHNHDTGAVRGLLCQGCNSGIGQFKENPDALLAAIRYLALHTK